MKLENNSLLLGSLLPTPASWCHFKLLFKSLRHHPMHLTAPVDFTLCLLKLSTLCSVLNAQKLKGSFL